MNVGKVKRSMNKEHIPERIPAHGGYSGGAMTGGGSLNRGGGHEEKRGQFEELKDMNRMYRTQLQTMQTERDKNLENNRKLNESVMLLRRKIDELKFEKAEMQKVFEQKGFQRNQVSIQDHEKLAKRYDQLCGQVKLMQHEREGLEQRHQQDKHDMEAQLMDSLRSVKLNLEDSERDRDSLRFVLAERKRELERVREQLSCLGPNQENGKKELSKILEDRDALRAKLGELKQDRHGLQEKLATANRTIEAVKSSAPGSQQVTELQVQVTSLQQQLYSSRKDRDELMESNNELRRSLDAVEMQLRDTDNECHRLRQTLMDPQRGISPNRRLIYERNSTSSGNLYTGDSDELRKFRTSGPSREISQGSMDEDLNMSSDASDHPSSFSDLTSLTRTSSGQSGSITIQPPHRAAEKSSMKNLGKLSSSASSLSNEPTKFPDQSSLQLQKVLRLEKSLEEVKKDNLNLNTKISDMETERGDLSSQLEALKKQLEKSHKELSSTSSKFKEARSQINMLDKEKGVALRDNAASYEQFIQLETQLREFKAEKQILEQQKDIAKKELDRVITDSVNAKKKLETIMIQRSKDAKDLSAMRHIKDKTVQEMNELKKKLEQLQKSHNMMEEEAGTIKEIVYRAVQKISIYSRKGASSSSSSLHSWTTGGGAGDGGDGGSGNVLRDLGVISDTLQQLENDRRVIVRKLFGQEGGVDQTRSLNDVIHCIDGFIHDKEDLMVEVDALHQSSSKHSEQRIFELKQKLEDLSSENKSLKREVNSRSQLLVNAEQNRDHLSAEYGKLDLQLQQIKNRHSKLVDDHDKTLDRVAERWKQNWPVEWDDGWEVKHVTVMLDAEGYAGFSVVGGCDQPQLPTPGAFFITMVNQGGPAEGQLKPGDVLESINGVSLSNAYHRDAVRAVKESKRSLTIGFRRRRHANHLMMGMVQPILSVPHLTPTSSATPTNLAPPSINEKPEQYEYSLYIDSKEKSDLGFRYDWSVMCKVSEVRSPGPADHILKPGDMILKVNDTTISKEKPSVVKKLMKPHKNILRLMIERPSKQERTYMGQPPPSREDVQSSSTSWSPKLQPGYTPSSSSSSVKRGQSWSEEHTPSYNSKHCDEYTDKSLSSHASFSTLDRVGLVHGRGPPTKDIGGGVTGGEGEGGASYMPYAKSRSRESYSSRDSKEGYSQDTQSQDSGSRPTKLTSMVTRVRGPGKPGSAPPTSARPSSDGVMYGEYNERRLEYDDVLASEISDSQYSQSESYLSESSYDYGLSSSQSIDLTFHTISSMPTHNRLTVETMMPTQAPTQPQQHSEDDDGAGVGFLARDDASRTTFRSRNTSDPSANTNGNNSEVPEGAERPGSSRSQSLSQEFSRERYGMGIRRRPKQKHKKSNSVNGSRSLSKLSASDQNLTKTSSNLSMRGRSRSQLSLGRAPSMTSVIEEPPRKSISTTDMSSYEHDPLADASYIRASFTYIPRNPKELSIKAGDVFHIHDEAPSERFRSSFWVSRLNEDGTDEQIGAIPNSMRGLEYLNDQGETLDFALYEEVEPYAGLRPVVILGALADQVMTSLLENLPNMFYQCEKSFMNSTGRVTEARLGRDLSEKKIIDFSCKGGGFDILELSSITRSPCKTKHCLMTGSPRAIRTLKAVAPPISILVKALTPESITTFSPGPISITGAKEIFDIAKELEEYHANEFTGSLFLVYMETLIGQIEDIIRAEKRKQSWVPVSRPENS